MNRYKHLSVMFLFFLLLVSCVSTSELKGNGFDSLELTDNNTIKILPTEAFGSEVEMLQVVNGYYNEQEYIMQTVLFMNNKKVSVSALTTLGNTLYDITYINDSIEYNTVLRLNDVSAVYMIADIQLCYYPVDELKRMLEDGALSLEVKYLSDGWIRSVISGDVEIITVKRKGSLIEYRNHIRNYGYSIEEIINE